MQQHVPEVGDLTIPCHTISDSSSRLNAPITISVETKQVGNLKVVSLAF